MTLNASVVVLTHNRPLAIAQSLQHIVEARLRGDFETLVIDDGSAPPLALAPPGVRIIRTEGVERSRARNVGALAAKGDLIIFLDDDITVSPDFVSHHLAGARDFDNALCVGSIYLTDEIKASAVGRFRQGIEEPSQNRPRGIVSEDNFCTAANMSMRRDTFLALGGFDPAVVSGEDQDLALRFSAKGGKIAYLPEASVLHRDAFLGIDAYCRRHEWGARAMAPLLRRYPERTDSKARLRFEHGHRTRRFFSTRLFVRPLLSVISAMERGGASDPRLFPLYRAALGLHLFRGFRAGLAEVKVPPPLPTQLVAEDFPGSVVTSS